jgi:hypothetical protein
MQILIVWMKITILIKLIFIQEVYCVIWPTNHDHQMYVGFMNLCIMRNIHNDPGHPHRFRGKFRQKLLRDCLKQCESEDFHSVTYSKKTHAVLKGCFIHYTFVHRTHLRPFLRQRQFRPYIYKCMGCTNTKKGQGEMQLMFEKMNNAHTLFFLEIYKRGL